MQLKCETILDIFAHENKTILCQIKVLAPESVARESRKSKNTCRWLTGEEWNTFDKELEKLIDCHNNDAVEWDNETMKFHLKPNIEVKVQKSKLTKKDFQCFLEEDDTGGGTDENMADSNGDTKEIFYVLECILEYKEQALSYDFLKKETQEYEPEFKLSPDSKFNSPATYEPYTPSKRLHRLNSFETVKTPGIDFLGYESREDTYSPKPITSNTTSSNTISEAIGSTIIPEYKAGPSKKSYRTKSTDTLKSTGIDLLGYDSTEDTYSPTAIIPSTISPTTVSETSPISIIPEYKAAPIKDTQSSKDEVIAETEDELADNYKPIRSKNVKKSSTRKRELEYIPISQEITQAPAYIPTPIEDTKKKDEKDHKSDYKEATATESLIESKRYRSNRGEKQSKKFDYKDKLSTRSKEKNKNLNENEKEKKNVSAAEKILQSKIDSSSDDEFEVMTRKLEEFKKTNHNENSQEVIPESQEGVIVVTVSSATTDTSPPKKTSKERHKKLAHHEISSLRRSSRSPSKPRRLIEEQVDTKKKTKTMKSSPKNKELFGSDDDDEDNDFENNNNDEKHNNNAAFKIKPSLFQTPKNEKNYKSSSSSSSSNKKKRKRDKSSDCEHEKQQMSSWLGKKKSSSDLGTAPSTSKEKSKTSSRIQPLKTTKKLKSTKHEKKRRSKSESPTPTDFVMPTKDELEEIRIKTKLQLENNEKLKAELEKIAAPPPKEVKNLSLKDMSVSDLLDTFDDYKSILDEIYKNNNKKDHIKSYEGINHCFVIRLMEPSVQYKMLQKLTDIYSSNNSTTQATLYANAMLPEWIIRIYMNKYKFTREEAMSQIKAQDDYQLHIDEQNESSFTFD